MCEKTIHVVGLKDQRTAYEVEEFLSGVPNVSRVQVDFLADEITIEYDETELEHDRILDAVEHAGCKPNARINGVLDRIRTKLTH